MANGIKEGDVEIRMRTSREQEFVLSAIIINFVSNIGLNRCFMPVTNDTPQILHLQANLINNGTAA